MAVKLTDEEFDFCVKYCTKYLDGIPVSRDMDFEELLLALNCVIVQDGLTKDQQTLNDFGFIAQDMYDQIYEHNIDE